MKKLCISLIISAFCSAANAQEPELYNFKEFKKLACTPIKNQERTGTCWCFSTLSFIESELLRMGKGEQNLSEMFVVRNVYRQKAENYVRRQGTAQFSEGGLAHDMLNAAQKFGLVPEEIYPGKKDPAKPFSHGELAKNLKKMCDEFVALAEKGELPTTWLNAVDSLLDVEFGGPLPRKFSIAGKPYTPLQYADYLGVATSEYVNLTSFSHHPFWQQFQLEVPDNWSNGSFYNLPLDDLMRCLNTSIQLGYTVEWDADVSNAGFAAKYGMALVPERDWKDKNEAQRAGTFKYVESEKSISQEYRQQLFDRQETMDDHLMHIVGILDEPSAGQFYVVKNSWGEVSDMKGFVYCSEAYMRLNTISFTFHKSSLPPDIRQKLGLENTEVVINRFRPGAPGALQTDPNPPAAAPANQRPGRIQPRQEAPKTPAPPKMRPPKE